MRSVDEMIAELDKAGWNADLIRCYGPGDWRAAADKKLRSGRRMSCEGYGTTVYEAVKDLCLECLGEGSE